MDLNAQPPGPYALDLQGLKVGFDVAGRRINAVNDATLAVPEGSAVGLVGESGSGKSTLVRAVVGMVGGAPQVLAARHAAIFGRSLDIADLKTIAGFRGRDIAMVFQDPLSYLNPLMRVDRQILEAVRLHRGDRDERARLDELLDMTQLARHTAHAYPHELSGGMRQRVLIAIALACRPRLLLADEPTTALDATTQKEILLLLRKLRSELGMALLLISHDLVAVGTLCEHVNVMYRGEIVESGPLARIFAEPRHPYTQTLLSAAQAHKDARGRFITRESNLS